MSFPVGYLKQFPILQLQVIKRMYTPSAMRAPLSFNGTPRMHIPPPQIEMMSLKKRLCRGHVSRAPGRRYPHTVMLTCFLPSASSKWNPKTNLKRSLRNGYCPLRIIHPTLFATSIALAFLPTAGRAFELLKVGSLKIRFRYAASSFACVGNEPNDPVGRALIKF